jgi:hypothetical protein
MTASVSVPAGTAAGSYPASLQATTAGAPATLTTSFTLNVTANPDFVFGPIVFPEVNAGSTGTTGRISITSQDGFTGTVTLSCPTTYGAGSCSISPTTVSSFPATATLTINGTSFAAGSYSLSVIGTSGSVVHTLAVPFNVGDYSISGTQTISLAPGGSGTASLSLASSHSYSGKINASCDASSLAGAMCSLSPANPVSVASGGTASLAAALTVPSTAIPGAYNINITTHDTSGAPSHSFSVGLTVAPDFRLNSSTPSQTVTAGQTSGGDNLTVQPVDASFTGAVTLACSAGMPPGAHCMFNPPSAVTPGNSAVDLVMNISPPASKADLQPLPTHPSMFYALWLVLPGTVIAMSSAGRRSGRRRLGILGSIATLLFSGILLSCGGVSTGGSGITTGNQPVTYQITVTGTSVGTAVDAGQSVHVTLVVD